MRQMDEIISLSTNGLNRHLNLGQHFLLNTSSIFISFERLSLDSLLNIKQIFSLPNVRLLLPSTLNISFDPSLTPTLRVRPLVLLPSRPRSCLSLSLFSSHPSNHWPRSATRNQPRWTRISRHRSHWHWSIKMETNYLFAHPPINHSNSGFHVILNSSFHRCICRMSPRSRSASTLLRHLRARIFSSICTLSISPDWSMFPFISNYSQCRRISRISWSTDSIVHRSSTVPRNRSMAGLFFVHQVRVSHLSLFEHPDIFSFDEDSSNDSVFTYFIDNEQTFNHHSIIFGVRQLNSNETSTACPLHSPPSMMMMMMFNERASFTSNYGLRLSTSACYYLDLNHQWRSDGMRVSLLLLLLPTDHLPLCDQRWDLWAITLTLNVSPLISLASPPVSLFCLRPSTGLMPLPMLISRRPESSLWLCWSCLFFASFFGSRLVQEEIDSLVVNDGHGVLFFFFSRCFSTSPIDHWRMPLVPMSSSDQCKSLSNRSAPFILFFLFSICFF